MLNRAEGCIQSSASSSSAIWFTSPATNPHTNNAPLSLARHANNPSTSLFQIDIQKLLSHYIYPAIAYGIFASSLTEQLERPLVQNPPCFSRTRKNVQYSKGVCENAQNKGPIQPYEQTGLSDLLGVARWSQGLHQAETVHLNC